MTSQQIDKGKEGGECNRKVCHNANARCFNSSTRAYYCRSCARKINRYTPGLCQIVSGATR